MYRTIVTSRATNKLNLEKNSDGNYVYKDFEMYRDKKSGKWIVMPRYSGLEVRKCNTLDECIKRIDTQTI